MTQIHADKNPFGNHLRRSAPSADRRFFPPRPAAAPSDTAAWTASCCEVVPLRASYSFVVRLKGMAYNRVNEDNVIMKPGVHIKTSVIGYLTAKPIMICTRVLNRGGKGVKSPVDDL